MNILIEVRGSNDLHAAASGGLGVGPVLPQTLQAIDNMTVDPTYPPVQLQGPGSPWAEQWMVEANSVGLPIGGAGSTYLLRGETGDAEDAAQTIARLREQPAVVGVFIDARVESTAACLNDDTTVTTADVSRALDVPALTARGMTGAGVHLAIVDSGIDRAALIAAGRVANLDALLSWVPAGWPVKPGHHLTGHGTMCAFDAGIAAPDATLLDHAVLLSPTAVPKMMKGLLSGAILSYSRLRGILHTKAYSDRAMVISNSWGMFSPAWDAAVGTLENYSDNPLHPFNRFVDQLERMGADILFAAGNCGVECPSSKCRFLSRPICGANSHPSVLCVAGVDINKSRLWYSSQGPGRLSAAKPDVAAYTHFTGSGVTTVDNGTSAACAVAAGLVAAVRTSIPAGGLRPSALRTLLRATATDLGPAGFDTDFGWGVIDTAALLNALP